MIRKDILPDVWGDHMQCGTPQCELQVEACAMPVRMVMCDGEADWPIFRIRPVTGAAPQPGIRQNGEGIRMATGGDSCGSTPQENIAYTAIVSDSPKGSNLRIVLNDGAEAEFYRLQGVSHLAENVNEIEVEMHAGAHLRLGVFTFGGTHVRNNIVVRMLGEGCTIDAYGLYLIDREQQVDNYLFVEHQRPRCVSRTLYKGIIDDAARARFNGHVLVQDGAVKTEAYQTNRNILLTDKAHVDTRPFLEIYNDDVKCSHGSTIGQLDEQAMFYLQSRGISERTAMTMLSYAFCDEVISGIGIGSLRDVVGDVVKKRLHGELTSCAECAIACKSPCNGPDAHFDIDPSRL